MINYSRQIQKNAIEAEKVWGQAYDILWKVISQKKLKKGVEIGVAFGGHSEAILKNSNVVLYSIDPYKHVKGYDDPMNKSQKEFDALFLFAKNRLKKFGPRSILKRMSSVEAVNKIKNKIDFIYIDADHSYEGVKRDIQEWFIKVNDGGIISGHDYDHPNFPGVKKAVHEFFDRFSWKIHTHKSGVWWVEKLPLPVSYIIPAYNAQDTINKSLESIIEGNFKQGDEIVVVDDASTDETKRTINQIKRSNKNIRVVTHSRNRGGGSSRNTAVKHAKNDIIFCLDSDNLLIPGSVEKLKNFLIKSGADCASFQEIRYFKEKTQKSHKSWMFKKTQYSLSDYLKSYIVPGASGNYLFTKNSFEKAGGYPEFAGALDAWGFGLRQVGTNQKCVVMPKSYYLHRIGHESYWVRDSKKSNMSLKALRILLPFFHRIMTRDQVYILSTGILKWFDNIPNRPIRLKEET